VTVRVRIAPSPTGNLHIGTARTAVFNWLYARRHGGQFILRIEDTDLERSKSEYTDNILDGLRWLGLDWDEGPFFQSQRLDLYRQGIQQLLDKKLAYRCYTSSEELDELRAAQEARGAAPRYDNRHRNLTPAQEAEFQAEGRQPVIRFVIDDAEEIIWNDGVRDRVSWKGRDLGGDMVIARAASQDSVGQPLYNLAVVIDDIEMKITHVIRGEDHISNTAKQILLYRGLEAAVPEFSHTPLILSPTGKKLSKRDGVTSIWDFKDLGYVAPALVNYMTLLGWSAPDAQEIFDLSTAVTQFDFDRVNKAGAKFDWDKLNWINSQYLHALSPEDLLPLVVPYWQAEGFVVDAVGDRPWLLRLSALIGASLETLKDAVKIGQVFFAEQITLNEEAQAQLAQEGAKDIAAALLAAFQESSELTEESAKAVIDRITKERGVKKGMVMRTARAALSGEVHGPDLIQSIILLHQHHLAVPRLQSALSPS
jgi:glutamyl-tRNA synthetase